MKRPWVVALLSIIPGLGFIALGKVILGLGVCVLVALFILLSLVIPIEDISIASYTLGFIGWVTQWYLAFMLAKRLDDGQAGSLSVMRRTLPNKAQFQGDSIEEFISDQVRQKVLPLLEADERLKVVLPGTMGTRSLGSMLLDIASGGIPDSSRVGHYYLGVTERDLILTKLDPQGNPGKLERKPLKQIRIIDFKQGVLTDQIVFDIGESTPMRFQVPRAAHSQTRQVLDIVNDQQNAWDRIDQGAVGGQEHNVRSGEKRSISLKTIGQSQPTDRPVLISTLLGAVGGAVGAIAGTVLAGIIGYFLLGLNTGGLQASEDAEGLGYLLGLYCLVMFPLGGSLTGAVPGALLGIFRYAQDRMLTPLQPLLAGFLTLVVLTVIAMLLLSSSM